MPDLSLLVFFVIEPSVLIVLVFCLQRCVGKNSGFFFLIKRTQLKAAHVQLLEKLRLSDFAETCRFQMIQSLEFQEIWPNNSLETT